MSNDSGSPQGSNKAAQADQAEQPAERLPANDRRNFLRGSLVGLSGLALARCGDSVGLAGGGVGAKQKKQTEIAISKSGLPTGGSGDPSDGSFPGARGDGSGDEGTVTDTDTSTATDDGDNGDSTDTDTSTQTSTDTATNSQTQTSTSNATSTDDSANVADPCNALNAGKLDTSKMPVAPNTLAPTVIAYGTDSSALVVVNLPDYRHVDANKLARIILVRPSDNRLIAIHTITSADVKADRLRPIAIDNLMLKGTRRFILAYVYQDGTYQKWAMDSDFGFVTTFRGDPVSALAPGQALPANFATNQGIPNFNHDGSKTGFATSPNPAHLFSGNRPLYTAQDNAVHVAAPGLAGQVICDIMGNEIAANGSSFTSILEYPTFIAYKKVGPMWFRTFIRIV